MRLFGFLTRHLKKDSVAPTELDEAVRAFQDKTGVRFNDSGLLRVALTHGSYVHEHPDTGLESMGRMELLGDSVLGLVVNEYLYANFPADEEGELTKMKSLLVSKAVLARRGRSMRLGSFLLLGEGEVDAGGRDRTSIVADGYESVIGAIYLDQGLDGARKFIGDTLLSEAKKILADSKHINYKSLLQEQVQGELRVHPEYRVLSETGPEHEKQFTVEVAVKRRPLGRGSGASKKEAEQAAAREALAGLEQAGTDRSRNGNRDHDRRPGARRRGPFARERPVTDQSNRPPGAASQALSVRERPATDQNNRPPRVGRQGPSAHEHPVTDQSNRPPRVGRQGPSAQERPATDQNNRPPRAPRRWRARKR
jgi:ribonuclease-3